MNLTEIKKELDKAFGNGFADKNPELVIKYHFSKVIETSAEDISSALTQLSIKDDLPSTQGGMSGGLFGMGHNMGMGMDMDISDDFLNFPDLETDEDNESEDE